jgi:hypothetical protein
MNSVTQIIGKFNPASDFMNDDSALKFGGAVHEMCRLYDLNDLNESKLDIHLQPYLVGWKKFLNDFKPEWSLIEQRINNSLFTGQLDRFGDINKKRVVLDIKTGTIQIGPCGFQLSGYSELLEWKIDLGYAVCLKENDYSIQPYSVKELKRYYAGFLSMLNTYNIIKNGFKL